MTALNAISRFGPPLLLMAVIYALSAQQDLNSGLGTIDLVGRKVVHAFEFGLLFTLWLRAFGWRRAGAAAALAVGYAVLDELHQTTVEGRRGTPVDVLFDSAGVIVAWLTWRRLRRGSGSASAA